MSTVTQIFSVAVTVGVPTVTTDQSSYASGATVAATVAGGPGNPGDWLGVYAVGAPTGTSNPPSWKWLSTDDARSSIPPAPIAAPGGTVHLVAPSQGGQFEVRLFLNNSFVVAATSPAITVTGPPPVPVITITPAAPAIRDTTSLGAIVAIFSVAMSDGSAFTGKVGFGPPNFDAGGVFALTGSASWGRIIVNPSGPGVGPNMATITDHISLSATP